MSTPSQEFLINAMRSAALRARLMEQDIKTIALALQSGMIEIPCALEWLRDVGAMPLIGQLPDAVEKASTAQLTRAGNGNERKTITQTA